MSKRGGFIALEGLGTEGGPACWLDENGRVEVVSGKEGWLGVGIQVAALTGRLTEKAGIDGTVRREI